MNNRIRELREAAGLTQEELADKVEVSRQTIISLEKGRYSNPSVLLAHRISRALETTIEGLFIFDADNFSEQELNNGKNT